MALKENPVLNIGKVLYTCVRHVETRNSRNAIKKTKEVKYY